MTLFKFLWINWDLGHFLAFLWGVLFGFLILLGIYVINVLASLRKSRYIMETRVKQIDKTEIEALIENAQNDYLTKRKEKDPEKGYLKNIIFGLVNDIAKVYYPKSKKPMAELTFDELLILSHYITDTIDSILSRPALKVFKRMKLSTVLNILDVRKNKAVKKAQEANEKYKISKVASAASMVYHAINPFYWFKKAVFDTSFSLITKKITLIVIEVVGEQTNKVFSKEALILEDKELNEMLTSLDDEVKDMEEGKEKSEEEDDIKISRAEKRMMKAIAEADEKEEKKNKEEVQEEHAKTREEKRKEREQKRLEAQKEKEEKKKRKEKEAKK